MTARGFVQGVELARNRLSAFSRDVGKVSNKVAGFGARLAVVGATKFAALSNAIKHGTTQLARFARGFIEFGKRLARVIVQLVKYTAVLVAGGVAIAGIYIRRTMQAVDATAKMADRIGMAIEDLQRLRYASRLWGLDVGKMDLLLLQFVRRIGEAQQGLTTYSRAFDQVKLKVRAMAQMDVYEAFMLTVEGLRALEQDTLRASAAYNMFGRQGQQAVNMIMAGRKAIEEAGAAVDKAGAAINRIDAAKIEMANDAITTAVLSAQAFWQRLTIHLAPAIKAAADWMFDLGTETIKTGVIMDEVFGKLGAAAGAVADVLKAIYVTYLKIRREALIAKSFWMPGETQFLMGGQWLSNTEMRLADVAAEITKLETDLSTAWGGKIEIVWDKIVADADKLARAIAKNREELRLARKIGQGVANTIEDMRRRAEALAKSLRTPWQVLSDSLEDYWQMLNRLFIDQDTWAQAVERAWEKFDKAINKVKDSLRELADPARLRFAPALAAAGPEAARIEWRTMNRITGAATVAVQQQQLKIQQGIGETLDEQNDMLRRGLRLEGISVLDVVT